MHHFQQMIQRTEDSADCTTPLLCGHSEVAQSLRQLATLAAGLMDAVLIKGPAGAGKFSLAQAIHAASPQRTGSLVAASGASMDPEYLSARWHGTLYLRHLMLLPVALQHRLLNWLDSEQAFHVRLIATSDAHDDSDQIIAPLRARLQRLYIPCPPLAQRRCDIAAILQHIWDSDTDRLPPIPDQSAWAVLAAHNWPENYRSLVAFAAMAAQLHGGQTLSADQVKQLLAGRTEMRNDKAVFDLKQHLAQEEKRFLVEALIGCNGVIAAAAARSGLKRTTFLAKMKRYGLTRI